MSVGADHTQSITSGGRYHDNCQVSGGLYTTCLGPRGGDAAIDIGAGNLAAGTAARLYADFAGYDTGGTVTPNNNSDIYIYAAVGAEDWTNNAACHWQRYDVSINYWSTDGINRVNLIGWIWIQHIKNKAYNLNTTIGPGNYSSRSNPAGNGTIFYLGGIRIADIYPQSDGGFDGICSTGAHTHIETGSPHAWGAQYEWHSTAGPDYFSTVGHTHGTSGISGLDPDSPDPVAAGAVIAFIGGGRVSAPMWDNVNATIGVH